MRTPSRRRVQPSYRPHLITLEDRLPLGDGVLGLLAGAALLPAHAASAVVPPLRQSAGVPVVAGVGNPSVQPDELPTGAPEAFANAAPAAVATPDWTPLTDPFAPAARRQPGPLPEAGDRGSVGQAFQPDHSVRLESLTYGGPSPLVRPQPADGALLASLAGMQSPAAPARPASLTPAQEAQVKENYGQLPLTFEQNVGQADASVHFFTRGPGYGLYLTSTEAVLVLQPPTESAGGGMLSRSCQGASAVPDCLGRESLAPAATAQDAQAPPAVVRLQLVGANATPAVTGHAEQPGKINYFLGNDASKWHTNIATFGRVQYDDVYPGIDLVWYGNNQQLEYDFVVSPGADPNAIRLNVSGAERLEIDVTGDLVHYGRRAGTAAAQAVRVSERRRHAARGGEPVRAGRRAGALRGSGV